jgi:hypothetical protein
MRAGGTFPAQDQMLQHARGLCRAEEAKDLRSLVASMTENIRHFDLAGMHRAVAICALGSSGSTLLASYLDGHDDVIMLPVVIGDRIYHFFERYHSLSLRDKLVCYRVFSEDFFYYSLPAANYYAAVNAFFEVYGNSSLDFLESRRGFFLVLHVVYCVAARRLPANHRPLMVYAQHAWDDQLARRFIEDFPQGRFIHTVRDPITNCSRWFDYRFASSPSPIERFLSAGYVIYSLTRRDIPHTGMVTRTLTIRFEDLHLHLEKTMRATADWLGLPYRSSLLESTFNGVPWVVRRGTISWSGARPEQAVRDSRNLSFADQCLLFAVLNEDFVTWNYPCPNIFKHAAVRLVTSMFLLLIPMKMELKSVRTLIGELWSMRRGRFKYAINSLVRLFICRLCIMSFVAIELCRRLAFRKKVLQIP